MAELLEASEIEAALTDLPGWVYTDGALSLRTERDSFPAAIELVGAVGRVAEARNHHPDIDIRWRTVTFACATHSAGGVTEADVELAREIQRLADGG